ASGDCPLGWRSRLGFRPRRPPPPSWSSRGQCRSPSPCSNPPSPWSRSRRSGSRARSVAQLGTNDLADVDLDRLGLHFLRLRQLDLEYPVTIGRLHLLRLYGHRQPHAALELPVDSLDVASVLALGVASERTLTLHGQQVLGDRQRHVLVLDPRQLELEHEVVLGLVHVDSRRPAAYIGRGCRSPQEASEEAIDLLLNVGHVAERIPSLH